MEGCAQARYDESIAAFTDLEPARFMENPLEYPTPPVEESLPAIPRLNDLTGTTLGDFQLVRRIGQGGMGQVYLARQLSLKRQVAVKILRTDLAANITALQRFQAEAEAVAQITHPNIVQVYAINQADGLHYMALEYVEGRNLRDYLSRKGPPEAPIAINIMRQVAAALQRAHELGFVHRDIKPENILLTRKGEVKVADFGLSRCFAGEQPLNITQSGVTMGTPLYMSPEQVQGHTVDPRSDIYSFGVTCYHMLAGEPPFKGQSPFEVALQHVQTEPVPLADIRPDLPPELCAIVARMMAKKPDDRYQTAREVLRDLTRLREGFSSTVAQAALAQSASSSSTQVRPAPSGAAPTVAESQLLAASRSHWGRWLLIATLLLAVGSVGAAIHWKTNPRQFANGAGAEAQPLEQIPNPARSQEDDLKKRLQVRDKSDHEALNALLELAMLQVREKRFDEALELFAEDKLKALPALAEPQKTFLQMTAKSGSPLSYYTLLGALGKGIILSLRDQVDESNREFRRAMRIPVAPKAKVNQPQSVDLFLGRYDHWKRAVADALERNSKNNQGKALDEYLNRYRQYSRMR
jgi:serine/threonine-protein kinase